MYWYLSSPSMSLYRWALTIPANCSAWGTCSSLYQRLNAAALSDGVVAFTMNRIAAMRETPGCPLRAVYASGLVDEADLHAAVGAAPVFRPHHAAQPPPAGGPR